MVRRTPKPEGVPSKPRFKAASKMDEPKPPRHVRLGALSSHIFLIEMDKGDSRTAAIVAAGLLEHNLAVVLLIRFRKLTNRQQKDLFEDQNSALNTFSAKIQIGFALNLYNSHVRDDLDAIRRIRNTFAHQLDVSSFDHPEVRDECDSLFGPKYLSRTEGKPEVTDRRQRVLNTAAHLAARFDLELKNPQRPPDARIFSYETIGIFPERKP
jgi:hypothetical protein